MEPHNNHPYQTVYIPTTHTTFRTANPSRQAYIPHREEFNVYGVEMYPDKIVFMISESRHLPILR